ncbi:hypothetical protein RJ639_042782 [Escallonia herrerae]|uniref:Uncharacterized protein n=1 Tax=Escallonia herrerae TaxID=1293975 RepID=A0AA89B292_9ASTE|nr:hypothetical protein RJ639_042782 [Escallonia herrerae]
MAGTGKEEVKIIQHVYQQGCCYIDSDVLLYSEKETTREATPSSFSNVSVGEDPDVVNLIVRCDDDSTHRLRQICDYTKEAIGWYRNCMVRYSNWTIFHTTESLPSGYMTNPKNASNTSQFNKALATFLYNLRGEAARGDSVHKFATASFSSPAMKKVYDKLMT